MSLTIDVTEDFEACLALRHTVFVQEQGVPIEEEQDALDATATHLLARDGDTPVGTARVLFQEGTAKVGRVCVLERARGTGLGADIIRATINIARETPGISHVKLGAQLQALGFYEKLGFRAFGPIYDDAGIDHRDMVLALA